MKTYEIYINNKKVGICQADSEAAARTKVIWLHDVSEKDILVLIPYVEEKVKA